MRNTTQSDKVFNETELEILVWALTRCFVRGEVHYNDMASRVLLQDLKAMWQLEREINEGCYQVVHDDKRL